MSSIPSGLPTIGPASVILLSQQGINSAVDVLRRGKDGHDGLPGMGPAKWAVLWQWASASVSVDDIQAEMERCLVQLRKAYEELTDAVESLDTRKEPPPGESLGSLLSHWLWDEMEISDNELGELFERGFWYRESLEQRPSAGTAVRDLSHEITTLQSKIRAQYTLGRKKIYDSRIRDQQRREQQMAEKRAREEMMTALGWLLKIGIPVIVLYWLFN